MRKLAAGLVVAIALASALPVHALGRAKKLPSPRSFNDVKDTIGVGHMGVLRPAPRRVRAESWGRSGFVDAYTQHHNCATPSIYRY